MDGTYSSSSRFRSVTYLECTIHVVWEEHAPCSTRTPIKMHAGTTNRGEAMKAELYARQTLPPSTSRSWDDWGRCVTHRATRKRLLRGNIRVPIIQVAYSVKFNMCTPYTRRNCEERKCGFYCMTAAVLEAPRAETRLSLTYGGGLSSVSYTHLTLPTKA